MLKREYVYDRRKPLGPGNYDVLERRNVGWDNFGDWPEKWLSAGDWWRFHRYDRLEVWDFEVQRVAEACGITAEEADVLMRRGLRDEVLAKAKEASDLI